MIWCEQVGRIHGYKEGWDTSNNQRWCVEAYNRGCSSSTCEPTPDSTDVVCRIFGPQTLPENINVAENIRTDASYVVNGAGSFTFPTSAACQEGEVKPDINSFDLNSQTSIFNQSTVFDYQKIPSFTQVLTFQTKIDTSLNTNCNDFQCTLFSFDSGSNTCQFCIDDNSTQDTQSRDCQWYYFNQGDCGNYDGGGFSASTQCCACQSIDDSLLQTTLGIQKITHVGDYVSSGDYTEIKFSKNIPDFAPKEFCIKCDYQNQRIKDEYLSADSNLMPLASVSAVFDKPINAANTVTLMDSSSYPAFNNEIIGRAFSYLFVNLTIEPSCLGLLKESSKLYEHQQSGNVTIIELQEDVEEIQEEPQVIQVKNIIVNGSLMTVRANQYHGFVLHQPELELVVLSNNMDCTINRTSYTLTERNNDIKAHPHLSMSYDPNDPFDSIDVYVANQTTFKSQQNFTFYLKVEVVGYDNVADYWIGPYKLINYQNCLPSYARFEFSSISDAQVVSPGPQSAYFQLNITLREGTQDCSPMVYSVGFLQNLKFVESQLLTITQINENFEALGLIPQEFDTTLVDRAKGEFIIWPKDPFNLEQSYENMYVLVNDTGNSSAIWGPVRLTLLSDTFTRPYFTGQPFLGQVFEFNVKDSDMFEIQFSKIKDDLINFCWIEIQSEQLGSILYQNCTDDIEYLRSYSLNFTFDHSTDESKLTINTKKLKQERYENNVTVLVMDEYGNSNWLKFTVIIVDEARIDFERTFVLEQTCGRLYQQWRLPNDVRSVNPEGRSGRKDDYYVDGMVYVRFDQASKNLIVGGIKSENAIGQYLATIDNEYNSNIVKMNMRINIISNDDLQDELEPCFLSDPEPKQQGIILTCKILTISKKGEVFIQFSEEVKEIDHTEINKGILDITINQNSLGEIEESQESSKDIKFDWFAKSFVKTILVIQIQFEDSLEVSNDLMERDTLQVEFLDNAEKFISKSTNQTLHQSSHLITGKIIPQYKTEHLGTAAVELKKEIAGFLTYGFWVILLFNQVASSTSSGHVYVQLINSLQMVIYLPLLQISFPANAMSIMLFTRPVAMFDVLDALENTNYSMEELEIWDENGDEVYEEQGFSEQMEEMGFESLHSLLNLGSLSFFLSLYVVKSVLFSILYALFVLTCKVWKEFITGQIQAAFFNEIIVITVEACFDIFISGYLQSLDRNFEFKYFGNSLSIILGVICFILTCIMIPSVYILTMKRPEDALRSDNCQQRFGSFYQNIKTSSKITLSYNMVFVLRRLIFVINIFCLSNQTLQFINVTFLNLLVGAYIGRFKPKQSLPMNRLEFFNELMIQLITIHVVAFSNLVLDAHTQYFFGYSMFVCVILLESVNISIVIYHVLRQMYLILKKKYNLIQFYWDNKATIFQFYKSQIMGKMLKFNLIEGRQVSQQGQKLEVKDQVADKIVNKQVGEVIVSKTGVKKDRVKKQKVVKKKDGSQKQTEQEKNRHEALMGLRNKNQLQTIQEEKNILIDLKQNTNRKSHKELAKTQKIKKGILNSQKQQELQKKFEKLPAQSFQSLPRQQKHIALKKAYSLRQQIEDLEEIAGKNAVRNSIEKQMVAKLDQEITANELTLAFNDFNREFEFNLAMIKKEAEKLKELEKQKEECQKYLPWDDFDDY